MNRTHAVLTAACFGVVTVMYRALPQSVPIHFDLHGKADGWMDKPFGAFLLPLTALVLAVLLHVFRRARGVVLIGTFSLALLLYTTVLISAVGASHHVDLPRALFLGLGVFFVALGNSLGKLRRNGLVGIRTPWTLASDEVWARTHRFGGPIVVMGGVAVLLEAIANASTDVMTWTLLSSVIVPAIYSYFIHRQLNAKSSP